MNKVKRILPLLTLALLASCRNNTGTTTAGGDTTVAPTTTAAPATDPVTTSSKKKAVNVVTADMLKKLASGFKAEGSAYASSYITNGKNSKDMGNYVKFFDISENTEGYNIFAYDAEETAKTSKLAEDATPRDILATYKKGEIISSAAVLPNPVKAPISSTEGARKTTVSALTYVGLDNTVHYDNLEYTSTSGKEVRDEFSKSYFNSATFANLDTKIFERNYDITDKEENRYFSITVDESKTSSDAYLLSSGLNDLVMGSYHNGPMKETYVYTDGFDIVGFGGVIETKDAQTYASYDLTLITETTFFFNIVANGDEVSVKKPEALAKNGDQALAAKFEAIKTGNYHEVDTVYEVSGQDLTEYVKYDVQRGKNSDSMEIYQYDSESTSWGDPVQSDYFLYNDAGLAKTFKKLGDDFYATSDDYDEIEENFFDFNVSADFFVKDKTGAYALNSAVVDYNNNFFSFTSDYFVSAIGLSIGAMQVALTDDGVRIGFVSGQGGYSIDSTYEIKDADFEAVDATKTHDNADTLAWKYIASDSSKYTIAENVFTAEVLNIIPTLGGKNYEATVEGMMLTTVDKTFTDNEGGIWHWVYSDGNLKSVTYNSGAEGATTEAVTPSYDIDREKYSIIYILSSFGSHTGTNTYETDKDTGVITVTCSGAAETDPVTTLTLTENVDAQVSSSFPSLEFDYFFDSDQTTTVVPEYLARLQSNAKWTATLDSATNVITATYADPVTVDGKQYNLSLKADFVVYSSPFGNFYYLEILPTFTLVA